MHAFVLFILNTCLLLSMLTSCTGNREIRSNLWPQQVNLLLTPNAGSTVVFDENGIRTSLTVDTASIGYYKTQENRGGMFSGGTKYYSEVGSVNYTSSSNSSKITLRASSVDPYRTDSDSSRQKIMVYNESYTSQYDLNFRNTRSSIVLNGITYTDVVLGIDSYRNDTLYWKQGIGILGWKRADVSWTAYRVF